MNGLCFQPPPPNFNKKIVNHPTHSVSYFPKLFFQEKELSGSCLHAYNLQTHISALWSTNSIIQYSQEIDFLQIRQMGNVFLFAKYIDAELEFSWHTNYFFKMFTIMYELIQAWPVTLPTPNLFCLVIYLWTTFCAAANILISNDAELVLPMFIIRNSC